MHILLKTQVEQPLPTVWAGFNRDLFEQLSPAFPPVNVIRFDGCLPGNVVHLQLNFLLFRQDWISHIIDQQTTPDEIFFVDKGTKLPFFLAYWQHRHRLCRSSVGSGEQTVIIDDITFRTPFRLTDYLFYPILWLQFAYRKPIYRRIFRKD
ncbi:SRPBCC family protein [Spirosoma flavum]|uniref:SRPBCC family protein n=1 Tax=Spirosoma flavum TaxID=2048557 RepID=A0ABW6AIH4_9BACT